MITEQRLLELIRPIEHVVLATVAADQKPEAAVVGIVVNDRLELFFDTSNLSRRVRPRWARYSDFRGEAPKIEELTFG